MPFDRALENALASVKMEGLPVSAQTKMDCIRLMRGDLSVSELVNEIIARPETLEG